MLRGQSGGHRRQYRARDYAEREHHPHPRPLHPKKIVLVSSSPQVRYPDYYGIDMSNMDEFIAFRAAVELLKERGMAHVVGEVYEQCKMQMGLPKEEMANSVKAIYAPFTDEDISRKMVEMLRPAGVTTPIEIVYQTLEGLHEPARSIRATGISAATIRHRAV